MSFEMKIESKKLNSFKKYLLVWKIANEFIILNIVGIQVL